MEGYATQVIGIVEWAPSVGVKALLAENSPIEGPPTEIKVLKGALGPLAGVGMGMMPAPPRVAKKGCAERTSTLPCDKTDRRGTLQ